MASTVSYPPSLDINDQHYQVQGVLPFRVLAPLVAVVVLCLVALFGVDHLYDPDNFQIDEIEVHGKFSHVNGAQIKVVVEAGLSGNYFSANLNQLENRIKQIPWVFSASLRRQWPSSIIVEVVEIQPVARWGEDMWLNSTGDLVDRQSPDEGVVEAELPILHGLISDRQIIWKAFQQWSGKFASNGLSLDELVLDPRDLWYLKLSLSALAINSNSSGWKLTGNKNSSARVTMVVDRIDSFASIERFIDALNQELIIQFPEMKTIDLRYPNGFAISWRNPESAAQILTDLDDNAESNSETSIE